MDNCFLFNRKSTPTTAAFYYFHLKNTVMRGASLLFIFFFLPGLAFTQSKDESAVRKVLADQTAAWNEGSIDRFMKGYWQNDSLRIIGQSGISYGYTNALNNYKKNYSDPDKMGKLFFTLLKVERLSPEYYFVIGKWLLKRKAGDIGGTYTLLFRKLNGQWLIVSDHTS
jgi:ketosteroid isomerase-like protein